MEQYKSLAAIIYVTDIEENAVMSMYDWEQILFDDDEQIYYSVYDAKDRRIVAAGQDEMGMTASATLTMKLIEHFRPQYVIMPGIAAGTLSEASDQQMYGDVVIADLVWNFSNGKYVPKEDGTIIFGEIGFIPRPTSVEIDEDLKALFEKAIASLNNENHVIVGAMASGSAVVANRLILDKHINDQYFNTKGVDMESYGVVYAAAHATHPRPKAIIAKSVCDFADNRKSDRYQRFASYTSCEFIKYMLSEIL